MRVSPAQTETVSHGRRNKNCSKAGALTCKGTWVGSFRRRTLNSSAGNRIVIPTVAKSIPPPAITPNSSTPRKPLSAIAKNAAAFVTPAVIMLGPVDSKAPRMASVRPWPRANSSSYREINWTPKSSPSPKIITANVIVMMFRWPMASVV